MEKHELEFLTASVDMINASENPEKTAKRMKWLIDHIESSEVYGRQHREWLEMALKNDDSDTVDFDAKIGEYVGSKCAGLFG